MLLGRRIHRRQAAEGAYYPDAFSIRIESDPPLINPATLVMQTDNTEDFSTFVHEYWHYLQNLTTIAGFSSFELFHDLAARFHETLIQNADGRSLGSVGCSSAHGQAVDELLEIQDARRGEDCPNGIDPQDVDTFEIVSATIGEYALSRNGQQVPFANNNLNRPALEELFRHTLPCDTIQSLPGDEDLLTRDLLVTFGVPPERWARLGYRPSDFLRTLECQVDYVYAHLSNKGFLPSADAESRCPFYTVCALPLRRDHPAVCRVSPWHAFDPTQRHHCWYGTAVASTLGIVSVRSLIGDPSIAERERLAIRAAVQGRAYEIWESEARQHGRDLAHWFRAKAELGIAEDVIV